MGRRELRDSVKSTWYVYEARQRGTPFSRAELDEADSRYTAESAAPHGTVAALPSGDRSESRSHAELLPSRQWALAMLARGAR